MSLERPVEPDPYSLLPQVPAFTLASATIADGEPMPRAQAHDGKGTEGGNESPQLSWSGFPAETQSFVVTCFDPDAPIPGGFWHWLLVDLPTNVTALDADAGNRSGNGVPTGAFHVRNDLGEYAYGGATPPSGDRPHRYYFVAHAVDVNTLGLTSSASAAMVNVMLAFHTLARAVLVPTYAH